MILPAIAVIADAHVHDPDSDYGGAGLVSQGRRRVWRSWDDTARGARAVNESRAALETALAEITAHGIRHVVLLGDYTDDGQAEATRRLAALLRRHAQRHGTSFYALPGNHDVFATHGKHTATRFARSVDATTLVTSDPVLAATEEGAILTSAMRQEGQPAALAPMAAFGYTRQPTYLHWETPFGSSDRSEKRLYTARSSDGSAAHPLMDASYLVEPSPGLWLLMLDANVFEPRNGPYSIRQKRAFRDPSDAGWNALFRVKPHLLPWIETVTRRARAGGKTLLTFSHYPALDPYEDDAGHEGALFGSTTILRRTPRPGVAEALARAGITFHVSGHLHTAALTRRDTAWGPFTNVAVPSLVAFPAGYAVLEPEADHARTTLHPLGPLLPDAALDEFYTASGAAVLPDYPTLLATQVRTRARTLIVPREWPPEAVSLLEGTDGLHNIAALIGMPPDDAISAFTVPDLVADWYLLRQGGPIAQDAVEPARLAAYRRLATFAATLAPQTAPQSAFVRRFLLVLGTSLTRLDAGPRVDAPLR